MAVGGGLRGGQRHVAGGEDGEPGGAEERGEGRVGDLGGGEAVGEDRDQLRGRPGQVRVPAWRSRYAPEAAASRAMQAAKTRPAWARPTGPVSRPTPMTGIEMPK